MTSGTLQSKKAGGRENVPAVHGGSRRGRLGFRKAKRHHGGRTIQVLANSIAGVLANSIAGAVLGECGPDVAPD